MSDTDNDDQIRLMYRDHASAYSCLTARNDGGHTGRALPISGPGSFYVEVVSWFVGLMRHWRWLLPAVLASCGFVLIVCAAPCLLLSCNCTGCSSLLFPASFDVVSSVHARVQPAAFTTAIPCVDSSEAFASPVSPPCHFPSPVHPLSAPNLRRLALVFDKLERGDTVHVGVVGGSNSAGWGMLNWRQNAYSLFRTWLQQRWPPRNVGTEHQLSIAARAATTSAFTSLCLESLLPGLFSWGSGYSGLDLLIVEFAVNDHPRFAAQDYPIEGSEEFIGSQVRLNMERLVRQVLTRTSHCALLFVYFAHFDDVVYSNIQEQHEVVARHYNIPSVSFKDIMVQISLAAEKWPQLLLPLLTLPPVSDRLATNKTLMKDSVHASDLGHYVVFQLLRSRVESLHEAYIRNERFSFSPPWVFDSELARFRAQFDGSGELATEGPLQRALFLESSLDVHLSCVVLSGDGLRMDQAQAEAFLHVEVNRGWRYEHAPNRSDKYFMLCDDDCRLDEAGDDQQCCYLKVRLAPALPVVGAARTVSSRSVRLLFNRSWRQMSDCWAWLTCSARPQIASQPLILRGQCHSEGSQMSIETLWSSARVSLNVTAGTSLTSLLPQLPPQLRQTANILLSPDLPAPCDLDTLHILKKTGGVFQFLGYIWS